MKSSVFWDIMPYSQWKVNRRFAATCRLHLQGRRIGQAKNQGENRWQAEQAGFLLGLFFGPENGGDMFL
jgi:hypothetical protein